MSDWALHSNWSSVGTDAGYIHPLTFTLYEVGTTYNYAGALIATRTVNALIPWRPEPTTGCGTAWLAADGNCYNGSAFPVTFDFTGVVVPDSIIFGLSYNTANYGTSKIGVAGPYNSLNYGTGMATPLVGSDYLPNETYWNGRENAGRVGMFRADTEWAPNMPSARFAAAEPVPEPATLSLLGLGLAGIARAARRRKK